PIPLSTVDDPVAGHVRHGEYVQLSVEIEICQGEVASDYCQSRGRVLDGTSKRPIAVPQPDVPAAVHRDHDVCLPIVVDVARSDAPVGFGRKSVGPRERRSRPKGSASAPEKDGDRIPLTQQSDVGLSIEIEIGDCYIE